MILRAIIADDEQPARSRIKDLLNTINEIEVIGEAKDGMESVNLINTHNPDLVFLDIQMPILNGFEVLERINKNPFIIFITAFDEYAVKAFEINAIDYLLKPYDKGRFLKSVNRVLKNTQNREKNVNQIQTLVEHYSKSKQYVKRITIKNKFTFKIFNINDIFYFRIENGLVFLHTEKEKYVLDTPLKRLEEKLDPSIFLRTHRKSIVNLNKIKTIIPWGKSTFVIELFNNDRVELSREHLHQFKMLMGIKL